MFSNSSISKRALHALWLLGVLLLGIGRGRAQLVESQPLPRNDDPFVAYHASLTNTADKVLAAAVQRSIETPRTDSHPPAAATNEPTIRSGPTGAINRVRQLRPIIEPILREERVPPELSAVVLVESGGQPNALSPKGARGVWQFMPDTARRYGLIVTLERDERLDIQRSTRAAARYLRDPFEQFGDWQLAFAAYNAGGDLVQRAIERNHSSNFVLLSSRGSLPLATPAGFELGTGVFINTAVPEETAAYFRPLVEQEMGTISIEAA
jgi:transglycosylase-like protein with SLT domain